MSIETKRRNGIDACLGAWFANACGSAQLDQVILAVDEIVYAWSKGEKSRENAVAEIIAEVVQALVEQARTARERIEGREGLDGKDSPQA